MRNHGRAACSPDCPCAGSPDLNPLGLVAPSVCPQCDDFQQNTDLLYPVSRSQLRTPNRQKQGNSSYKEQYDLSCLEGIQKQRVNSYSWRYSFSFSKWRTNRETITIISINWGITKMKFDECEQFPFLHDHATTTTRTTAFFFLCKTKCFRRTRCFWMTRCFWRTRCFCKAR